MECIVCKSKLSGQKKMYCSNACKQKHHYDKIKFQTNTYHSQTIRSLKRKIELIKMRGNGCQICGYNKNIAALEFHHRDSNQKESRLDARILSNRTWAFILTEFEKCDLLCSNCHKEIHNPELTIHNIQIILQGAAVEESIDGRGLIQGNLND
jgi:hypothetical protein